MTKTARICRLIALSLASVLTLSAASQTISFYAIPNQIFGISPFQITAKATSGLPVTFTSTTPGVCKLASGLVTLLTSGTCTITASQGGNGTYSPAASVTQSFTVIPSKSPSEFVPTAGIDYPTGAGPSRIVVADVNLDGFPDLVTADANGPDMTILLGDGSGRFAAAPGGPISMAKGPYQIVVGDFNGDGIPDIAATNIGGNTVAVMLGDGAGGFNPAPYDPIVVNDSLGLAVGDFNGDGIEDLAATDGTDATVTVLLGNGLGGFTATANSPFSTGGAYPEGIAVGDFNGDGMQDLVVANTSSSNMSVFLGDGTGNFTLAQDSPFITGWPAPNAVAVGDFNGDGNADFAIASQGSALEGSGLAFLGQGNGQFSIDVASQGAYTLMGIGSRPSGVAVADFAGNGIQDFAVVGSVDQNEGNDSGVELLGNGSGGFTPVGFLPFGPGANPSPYAIAVGDFNGDGIEDIATTDLSGNAVTVLLGGPVTTTAVLSTTSPATIQAGQSVPLTLTVSDYAAAFSAPHMVTFYDGTTVLGTATQTASPYTFSAVSLGAGTHTFTATYSANPYSLGSSSNVVTIQVLPPVALTPQTIAFAAIGNLPVGTGEFAITATATSGLTVSFAAPNTSSVCTVTPTGTVTILAVGTCSITASQGGNAVYAAATSVTQSFLVISNPVYLATNVSPDNSGTITASPASLNNYYSSGTTVCLTATPAAGQIFTGWTGTALNAANCLTTTAGASVTASFGANPVTAASALRFLPATPCRLVDTRNPAGPLGGPGISGGSARSFTIPGVCGIPPTALAYSLNLTVVPQGTLGYVTLWPTGQTQPVVSTLNSLDGRIKSNAAIVPAGTGGAVSVFATNSTDVILDINGYFDSYTDNSALQFYPLTPCRVADTRNATGSLGGPSLLASQARSFPIMSSACGIPGNASAYSLNFTAIPQGPLGYLTVFPSGQSQPVVSTLNAPTGAVTANAAIVPAGTGGAIELFVTNNSDMAIDINGYFAAPGSGGLSLYNLPPCRIEDTRLPAGTPAFTGTVTETATGATCGVPPEAQSLVLNATVVPSGELGYISLWANGGSQPVVSTLNALDGSVTSNMAVVPTTNGLVDAFASGPAGTYLILDTSGYFAP